MFAFRHLSLGISHSSDTITFRNKIVIVPMHLRKDKTFMTELKRKAFHFMGLPVVIIYAMIRLYISQRFALWFLAILLLFLIKAEYVRLEYKPKMPEQISSLFRSREKNNVSGSIFYIASLIIVFATCDFPLALVAACITIFGDMTSAIFGMQFGKKKLYRNKTYVGTTAGLLTNIAVGAVIIPYFPLVYIPMAITGTFVEMITNRIDDNLTVPLFSAFVGQMIVFAMDIDLMAVKNPILEMVPLEGII